MAQDPGKDVGTLVEGDFVLGNTCLELRFQRIGTRVAASALLNKSSGRLIALTADDFSLSRGGQAPLQSGDFKCDRVEKTAMQGGQRLRLTLRGGAGEVVVIYELMDGDYFLRRHLEFAPASPMMLRQVEVWRIGLPGVCSSQETGPPAEMQQNVWGVERKTGFGKPVFLEDSFWGLEFPAGYNHYSGGILTMSHLPGRMVSERFISKPAVLGVSPPGEVAARFRRYIAQERLRPGRPMAQVDYNTWTTVSPATEANSLELIQQFQRNLFEAHGVAFDSFTLDDGWDEKESLWDIRRSGFPHGFQPLLEALRPMGTRLGLWLSPSSGYDHAAWGGKNGYSRNATFDWFLCQSDPGYRQAICRVVPDLIRQNGVGFFKMDGFCASCDTHRHAHHLDGDYAREANVDAFIELLSAMRKEKPDIYLDPTSGMWLSPWWLWYVDSVYADTYDGTAPALVPSPNGFDGATTSRDALLRRRLRENPGFDPAAIETLGVYLDPTLSIEPASFFDNWHDNAMMVAGRGNRLLTFYMNPANFPHPERDWPFLAAMIQWARHHGPVLADTTMILGDPHRREPYGYSHFAGSQGIIVLRNPFIGGQPIRLCLDESAGWPATVAGNGAFTARIVYPWQETLRTGLRHGDTLELTLDSYQMVLIQTGPSHPAALALLSGRFRETGRSPQRIRWEIYGAPGSPIHAGIAGFSAPGRISLDGQQPSPEEIGRGLAFPGAATAAVTVEGGLLRSLQPGHGRAAWQGECTVSIPGGTRAFIHIVCLDPQPDGPQVRCRATIGGIALPGDAMHTLTGSRTTLRPVRELPLTPWVMFRFALPEGKSVIAITLESTHPEVPVSGMEAGWWLRTEQTLCKALLEMEFDEALPPAPAIPLPFPSQMELQRQTYALQALTLLEL